MEPIIINNVKTILIFLGVTLVFAVPTGYVVSFAEKNVGIKGTALIVLITVIALVGYFILGRKFLTRQISVFYNMLSTILPLIVSIIFVIFKVQAVFVFVLPLFPIMALLANTTRLGQGACIVVFSVLSWLSVTLGLFFKMPTTKKAQLEMTPMR